MGHANLKQVHSYLENTLGVSVPSYAVWEKYAVDIVVPVFGGISNVERCVKNTKANTYFPYRLILVEDGCSAEDVISLQRIAKKNKCDLISTGGRKGFPHSCNLGWRKGKNPFICFLNSDAFPGPYWLSLMMGHMLVDGKCGAIGPSTSRSATFQKLEDFHSVRFKMTDEDIAAASVEVLSKFKRKLRRCGLSGFCMITRRSLLNQFKGFDESYGLGYGEEDHFQTQIWNVGYQSLWCRYAYVHHLGGQTFKKLDRDKIKQHRRRNKSKLRAFRRAVRSRP
jgi:GT2 family glycosyltransferase